MFLRTSLSDVLIDMHCVGYVDIVSPLWGGQSDCWLEWGDIWWRWRGVRIGRTECLAFPPSVCNLRPCSDFFSLTSQYFLTRCIKITCDERKIVGSRFLFFTWMLLLHPSFCQASPRRGWSTAEDSLRQLSSYFHFSSENLKNILFLVLSSPPRWIETMFLLNWELLWVLCQKWCQAESWEDSGRSGELER